MRLSLEQDGTVYTLEVISSRIAPQLSRLPAGVTGIRYLNHVMLMPEHFDRFIHALTEDDFVKAREILAHVIDKHTRELVFQTANSVKLLENA